MYGEMKSDIIGIDANSRKDPFLKQTPLEDQLEKMQFERCFNMFHVHFDDFFASCTHFDQEINALFFFLFGF